MCEPNKLRNDTHTEREKQLGVNHSRMACGEEKNRSQLRWNEKQSVSLSYRSKFHAKKGQKQEKNDARIHIINEISLELCSLHLQD